MRLTPISNIKRSRKHGFFSKSARALKLKRRKGRHVLSSHYNRSK